METSVGPTASTQVSEREAFRRLEHGSWERVAGKYDEVWGPLTRQFVPPLLDAAGVGPGKRVLDLACGPGYAAAAAATRGADALGVDFAAAMVLEARRTHPGLEFRQADAEHLPFPPGSFDAALVNFGILHFAEPERALAEARRVLVGGGRLAFTAWAPAESPGALVIQEAIQAHADFEVGLPEGPPHDLFADPAACQLALEAAGFRPESVRSVSVTRPWRVASPQAAFEAERQHGVRTAALLARQRPEVLEAIRRAIARAPVAFACDGGYALPMTARVVSAVA